MKETVNEVQAVEVQTVSKPRKRGFRSVLTLALAVVMCFALALPAFAEDGTGSVSITSGVSTVIELMGSVFSAITSNTYLMIILGAGLLLVGIRVLRAAKRAIR